MLKIYRKTIITFFSVGSILLFCACQSNTEKTFQQELLESDSIEQSVTEQASINVSDSIEQINVYTSPGTNYLSMEIIDKDTIEKAIKIESGRIEIEIQRFE
jgi:hypothetical protein